ncbi:MAG: sulfite exporter TauE/SafE family protein [Deltaproteobacteria bacterium]|nr:sulfite exporter TauE/SafE family protein [Deltaproteobacteria bacterium]
MTFSLLLLGVASGAVSGLLGIGGAVILIPALIYFFKMTQHQAQGTSLAVLLPPIGLMAFLEYYRGGHVNVRMALMIAAGFFIGGFIGAYAAQYIPGGILKKAFGVLLLIAAIDMILR